MTKTSCQGSFFSLIIIFINILRLFEEIKYVCERDRLFCQKSQSIIIRLAQSARCYMFFFFFFGKYALS